MPKQIDWRPPSFSPLREFRFGFHGELSYLSRFRNFNNLYCISKDASIEERLRVIEEALKQVLHATGLPPLDSISHELGLIRDPASRRLEAIFSQEDSLSAGLLSSEPSPIPHFRRNGDAMRVFPTPIEHGIITLEESSELTAM
jgi:hypothetical protein